MVHQGLRFPVESWLTVAPESRDLEHPVHFRHLICHRVAFGPGFSSCTDWIVCWQPGHVLRTPNLGNGRARRLMSEDGFTAAAAAGDDDTGTDTECKELGEPGALPLWLPSLNDKSPNDLLSGAPAAAAAVAGENNAIGG